MRREIGADPLLFDQQADSYEAPSKAERILRDTISAAVDLLGEPHRSAIEALFYEGIGRKEYSNRIGVPDSRVRAWVAEGVGQIGEHLKVLDPDGVGAMLAALQQEERSGPLPLP